MNSQKCFKSVIIQESCKPKNNALVSRNEECFEDHEDYFLFLDTDEHVQDDYITGYAEHNAKRNEEKLFTTKCEISKSNTQIPKGKEYTAKKRETGVSNLIVNENNQNEITLSSEDSESESIDQWYIAMLNRKTTDCESKQSFNMEIASKQKTIKHNNSKTSLLFETCVRSQLSKNIEYIQKKKVSQKTKIRVKNCTHTSSNQYFCNKNISRINSLAEYNKSFVRNKSILNLKSKYSNEKIPFRPKCKSKIKIDNCYNYSNPYSVFGSLVKRAKSALTLKSSKCSVSSYKQLHRNINIVGIKTTKNSKRIECGSISRHTGNFVRKIPKSKVSRNTEIKKDNIYASVK